MPHPKKIVSFQILEMEIEMEAYISIGQLRFQHKELLILYTTHRFHMALFPLVYKDVKSQIVDYHYQKIESERILNSVWAK